MSSSSKEFRVLLFEISEELHQRELRGIIYTEGLPQRFYNEPALTILMKLEMMGRISEKEHKYFEDMLRTFNRHDLAKKVEKFSKQKRKKKQSTLREELHPTANLEVGLVQTRLLLEHLQNTAASAPSGSMKVIIDAAKGLGEQLEKALLDAKSLQDQSDTSPQNKKLQSLLPKVAGVRVNSQKKPILPPKPSKLVRKGQLQTVHEPEETDYEDEGNYTGGTTGGSGSGTGSGFVDPTPYLKVGMKKSPRLPNIEDASPTHMTTAHYKTICKDEVDKPSYYKMANREMNNQKYRGYDRIKAETDEGLGYDRLKAETDEELGYDSLKAETDEELGYDRLKAETDEELGYDRIKTSYRTLIPIQVSINVAQVLIDNGSDVNMQDDHGKSVLMIAIEYNYPQMVQLLLDKGAQVNMQDSKGYTALSIATKEKSTEIIKQLLRSGAEVDHVDNEGFSPLMLTCCDDQFEAEVAEQLLVNGANIDLQNNNGTSSLIMATQNQHMKQITFLLQHGALVNIQDNQGLSPLMIACKKRFMQPIDLLVKHGAQIDLQDKDGKSALLHAVSNKCILDLTGHLIKLGAQVNLQDNSGWFSLMYAVKAEDLEAIQLLVANGVRIELRNCNGQTIFDVCPQHLINLPFFQELFRKLMSTVNNNDLRIDQNFPEIVFYKTPISIHITSSGRATIDRLQDMGISISVPEGSLSPSEEPLDLHISPCFCGPFRLPQEYESASPAYLIHHSKKTNFQKDIIIRIHHYASIGSKEDCEKMAFLSASSTPEYIESHRGEAHPMFTFKKIRGGANAEFRPGDQVGEISLRHFCILKTGKRKRSEEEPSNSAEKKQRENDCLYSVRLYRNVQNNGGVFCICLYSPIYIKHCDKVIIGRYSGMSKKEEGKSQVLAKIVGDGVTILPNSNNSTSSVITFDRNPSEILIREIHLPEILKIEVSKLLDYPPRIKINADDTRSQFSFDYPEVQINGLDIKCSLQIFTQPLRPTLQQPSPMEVQGAMVVIDGGELKVAVSSTLSTPPAQVTPSPGAASLATPPDVQTRDSQELNSPQLKCDLAAVDANPLECNDLGDVVDEVESLSTQWRRLSAKLRLKEDTLNVIEYENPGDAGACLRKALEEWLKLNYDRQRHGRPSWRRLAEAVSKLDYALSEKIATAHTHSS